jgi:hypothetical protein
MFSSRAVLAGAKMVESFFMINVYVNVRQDLLVNNALSECSTTLKVLLQKAKVLACV